MRFKGSIESTVIRNNEEINIRYGFFADVSEDSEMVVTNRYVKNTDTDEGVILSKAEEDVLYGDVEDYMEERLDGNYYRHEETVRVPEEERGRQERYLRELRERPYAALLKGSVVIPCALKNDMITITI